MEKDTVIQNQDCTKAPQPGFSRRDFLLGGMMAGLTVAAAGAVTGCAPKGPAGAELASTGEEGVESDAPALGPNQYQAKAIGIDEMTVTMEIVDGRIENVEIDANESPECGQGFIPMLVKQILDKQSGDIDIITGATITSFAVRDAARNCIAQAREGADPLPEDDCISPIEPAPVPEKWDYEADVVIVGASLGGITTAAKLAENGVSVIVLEKEARAGGGGRVTSCIENYGGNKVWGDGPAYFADEYHDSDVMDYFQDRAHWTIDNELLRNNVIALREFYDWASGIEGASFCSLGTWWSGWAADTSTHTGTKHHSGQMAYFAKWMKDTGIGYGAEYL